MTFSRRILFHRFFQGYSGGHLKVNDYIDHSLSVDWLKLQLFVDPTSISSHLWHNKSFLINEYKPQNADILFIAGVDWRALTSFVGIENQKLIINLIQHVRHADPNTELYSYLNRRAIRLCVSQEVTSAITETKVCNGPIYTIPNGVRLEHIGSTVYQAQYDVVIAGLKNPTLANSIASLLTDNHVSLLSLTQQLPRREYLRQVSQARVVITLPNLREGFYLPALEAMAMGIPLVCPDCIGNRSFCRDNDTCLMPPFDAASIVNSALLLLRDDKLASNLKRNAKIQSSLHSLETERVKFLNILSHFC